MRAQATVAPAKRACVDQGALWSRMDAHGISQNEVARRAGISSAHLSQIIDRQEHPVAGRSEEVARGPVPAGEERAGCACRGEGAGIEEG